MWVDISKRLPPDEAIPILVQVGSGRFFVTNGALLNVQQRQLRAETVSKEDIPYLKHTGYFAVKWMRIHI